jgi:hypothetical protein
VHTGSFSVAVCAKPNTTFFPGKRGECYAQLKFKADGSMNDGGFQEPSDMKPYYEEYRSSRSEKQAGRVGGAARLRSRGRQWGLVYLADQKVAVRVSRVRDLSGCDLAGLLLDGKTFGGGLTAGAQTQADGGLREAQPCRGQSDLAADLLEVGGPRRWTAGGTRTRSTAGWRPVCWTSSRGCGRSVDTGRCRACGRRCWRPQRAPYTRWRDPGSRSRFQLRMALTPESPSRATPVSAEATPIVRFSHGRRALMVRSGDWDGIDEVSGEP